MTFADCENVIDDFFENDFNFDKSLTFRDIEKTSESSCEELKVIHKNLVELLSIKGLDWEIEDIASATFRTEYDDFNISIGLFTAKINNGWYLLAFDL